MQHLVLRQQELVLLINGKKMAANIPGATSSTYTINNVTTADAGNFTVIVSGVAPCPSVTSAIATISSEPGRCYYFTTRIANFMFRK